MRKEGLRWLPSASSRAATDYLSSITAGRAGLGVCDERRSTPRTVLRWVGPRLAGAVDAEGPHGVVPAETAPAGAPWKIYMLGSLRIEAAGGVVVLCSPLRPVPRIRAFP